jgi:hypothetical protein
MTASSASAKKLILSFNHAIIFVSAVVVARRSERQPTHVRFAGLLSDHSKESKAPHNDNVAYYL